MSLHTGTVSMQKLLHFAHYCIGTLRVVLETRRDIKERKRNVSKRVIVFQSIDEIGISLKSNRIPIHDDCLQLVVDLQSFRKKARTQIAHQISADVEHLKMLIAAQGIDEVVYIRFELVLGDVELTEHEIILLNEIHQSVHHRADVFWLHTLETFDEKQ